MKVTYEIENGNKVRVKTYADGRVYKYDEKRNLIYYKDSFGSECWDEYDENGNHIHHKSIGSEYENWCEHESSQYPHPPHRQWNHR